jgi:hypothetical protein
VLLRRAGGLPDTSLLLDGTPAAAAGWNGDLQEALPVGTPVPVSAGDFTVVVQSAGADGAVLSVTPMPPTTVAVPAAAAPAPRATTPAPRVLPGSTRAPAATSAAGFAAPSYDGSRPHRATPALEPAADSRGSGAFLIAAGALLAAVLLLSARRRWGTALGSR